MDVQLRYTFMNVQLRYTFMDLLLYMYMYM